MDGQITDFLVDLTLLTPVVVMVVVVNRKRRRRGTPIPEPTGDRGPPGWAWDPEKATWRNPDSS